MIKWGGEKVVWLLGCRVLRTCWSVGVCACACVDFGEAVYVVKLYASVMINWGVRQWKGIVEVRWRCVRVCIRLLITRVDLVVFPVSDVMIIGWHSALDSGKRRVAREAGPS